MNNLFLLTDKTRLFERKDGFTFIKTNNTRDIGYLMKEKPIMNQDISMIGLWILLILCLILVWTQRKKLFKKAEVQKTKL